MIIKTNKENKNYLSITRTGYFCLLSYISSDKTIAKESEIYKEFINLLNSIKEYENKNHILLKQIEIKKESTICNFFENKKVQEKYNIKNLDQMITKKEIISAMNIAIFENNTKKTNKIMPLFQQQIEGTVDELKQLCGESTIDYIKENNDLDFYLANLNDTYVNQKYYVYENNEITKRKLKNRKVLTRTKR